MDQRTTVKHGNEPVRTNRTLRKIEEALLALTAEGERINHDLVAERAGVSRRTVYRYFPDREALLGGLWSRLSPVTAFYRMPDTVDHILTMLERLYTGFDDNADAMTVVMASAEGRTMRNLKTAERRAGYRKAFADVTAHLNEPQRTEAVAVMQLLNSGFVWREMRDQWELDGLQMAEACRWAIETLLADLRAGGGPGRPRKPAATAA